MVYNFHLLSQISNGVLNCGPIWGHNGFMFESCNSKPTAVACSYVNIEPPPEACQEASKLYVEKTPAYFFTAFGNKRRVNGLVPFGKFHQTLQVDTSF